MTASRDPDRMIHAFIGEGEETLDDQVYDAVRAEIEQKRQRAGLGPWRTPVMNKIVTFGLAAAAVVAAVFIGVQLFGSPGGGLGSQATPTPEPTEVPTPAPSADAFLPVGPFLVADAEAPEGAPRITVTIPASGWTSLPDFGGLTKGAITDGASQAAVLLWAWPVGEEFEVYGDPCQWQSTIPDTPATTVDEIAAALAAQASRDGSDPVDVTVNGYTGKKVTLHVPDDAVFENCAGRTFASYGVAGAPTPVRTHQGPGQVDEIWILNVNGAVSIIHVMYGPETPAGLIEEMRTIAESATFAS